MAAAPDPSAATAAPVIQGGGFDAALDQRRLTGYQVMIIAVCAGVAVVDGFDNQVIALAAPEIALDFGVPAASFGTVFGSGLLGGLIGAVVSGMIGDRIGRKPTLLVSLAVMALASLGTPFVGAVGPLIAVRFLTGLGLGGALPSIIAITSEYARPRSRAATVALMFSGYPAGAVIGGLLATVLIPALGWTSVFWVGGTAPLVLIALIASVVPESVRFLSMRPDRAPLTKVLRRLGLPGPLAAEIVPAPAEQRSPLLSLFTRGRALGTVLLWVVLLLSLLISYFLLSWIPIIARQNGIDARSAILGAVMVNLGSIVGSAALGRVGARIGTWVVILGGYVLGAIAIAAIGASGPTAAILLVTTFLAGLFTIGAQLLTVALCATFYDDFLRATGVGSAVGIARIGAIIGPVLGGVLLAAGTPTPTIFLLIGGISLVCALAVAVLGTVVLPRRARSAAAVRGRADLDQPV